MPNTFFLAGVDQWVGELGRLRDVVRQHVVATQLAEIVGNRGPLRVLDVGCGQGTQSLLLAREGHLVTGLDLSATLLDHCADLLAVEREAGTRDPYRQVAALRHLSSSRVR